MERGIMTIKQVVKMRVQRFARDASGNMIVFAAIAVPVLVVGTGAAVDISRYLKYSGYIQAAVDKAALAAVSVDGQNRQEIVDRFFYSSLDEKVKENIDVNSINTNIVPPAKGNPLSVTVTANVKVNAYFGGAVGMKQIALVRTGQASREMEDVEVVITMASSGTMCSEKVRANNTPDKVTGDILFGGRPDPTCAHFNTMKQGVRDFVKSLDENVTVGSLKVGLVPYNHKVRLPDTNTIPPTLIATESAQYYRDLRDAEPLSPTLALTSDTSAVLRAIDAMQQTPDGLAWGRSDLASHVAGLLLEPEYHQYFATGEAPAAFGSAKKAVILMTDGANIGCCFTNWKPGDFNNQYVYFYEPYNQSQMAICEALKAQGVKIFSVMLDVKDTDPGGKQINNTFARCASGAYGEGATPPEGDLKCKDKQYCYNVSSDEELLNVYRQIAQSFYQPKITQ